MDFKKSNTPVTTVTRDMIELSERTGNEQIEISRYYERLPKPTLIATQEYIDHKLFFRKSIKDRANN